MRTWMMCSRRTNMLGTGARVMGAPSPCQLDSLIKSRQHVQTHVNIHNILPSCLSRCTCATLDDVLQPREHVGHGHAGHEDVSARQLDSLIKSSQHVQTHVNIHNILRLCLSWCTCATLDDVLQAREHVGHRCAGDRCLSPDGPPALGVLVPLLQLRQLLGRCRGVFRRLILD
jgi:hypothetical protein